MIKEIEDLVSHYTAVELAEKLLEKEDEVDELAGQVVDLEYRVAELER